VAVLIGKALIEFPPKFAGRKPVNPEVNELHQWKGAQGLAEDIRYYGRWMREEAEKKTGHLYPSVKLKDGKEATVIAWLWALTVPSPDPRARGVHVPLASSFVLSAKIGKEVIVKPVVDRLKMTWAFEIDNKPSKAAIEEAKAGTKAARATFACLLTGTPIGGEYIDAEAQAGRMAERLMAIVAEGTRGRAYLPPTFDHASAADAASKIVAKHGDEMDLPTQECRGTFASNAQGRRYRFRTFVDYFTPRQLVALTTFSDLVIDAREKVLADAKKHWSGAPAEDGRQLADGGLGPVAYADVIATYLAMAVDRVAMTGNNLVRWNSVGEKAQHAFGRQSLPMIWGFAEPNFLADATGSVAAAIEMSANGIEMANQTPGLISMSDATAGTGPARALISTDPPYYNNVAYAIFPISSTFG
jgi:putative DNA methylase